MPTRLQTQQGLRALDDLSINQPALRPVASPVDTFVQTNAGDKLSALARGLSAIAPAIARYGDVTAQQNAESDKATGNADLREYLASGKTYADAVKEGKLDGKSAWYRLGFKESAGQVSAYKFGSDFQKEVQDKLSDGTDVGQFDKVASDFRANWLKQNGADAQDVAFSQGFGALADSLSANARSSFVAGIADRMKKASFEQHTATLTATVQHELDAGTARPAISEALHMLTGRAVALGMDTTTANMAAITAIANIAKERGDTTLLHDLAVGVQAGDLTLDQRPTAQAVFSEAAKEISDKQWEGWTRSQTKAAATRQDESRTAYATAASRLFAAGINAGSVDIEPEFNRLVAIGDASGAEHLRELKNTVVAGEYDGDPTAFHDVYNHLVTVNDPNDPNFVTVRSIGALQGNRKLSVQQANFLLTTVRMLREKQPVEKDPLNIFDRAYSQLNGHYGGDINVTGEIGAMRSAALQYLTQARVAMDMDGSWDRMTATQRQDKMDALVKYAKETWHGIVPTEGLHSSEAPTMAGTAAKVAPSFDFKSESTHQRGGRAPSPSAAAYLHTIGERAKLEVRSAGLTAATIADLRSLGVNVNDPDAVQAWIDTH